VSPCLDMHAVFLILNHQNTILNYHTKSAQPICSLVTMHQLVCHVLSPSAIPAKKQLILSYPTTLLCARIPQCNVVARIDRVAPSDNCLIMCVYTTMQCNPSSHAPRITAACPTHPYWQPYIAYTSITCPYIYMLLL
jgi:hypothetical protein